MLKRTAMAAAVAVAVLIAGLAGPAAGMRLGQPAPDHDTHSAATLADALAGLDAVPPAAKLSAGLADLAKTGDGERREPVVVQSIRPLDLGGYADFVHQFTWPAGEHVAVLEARVTDLAAIAALPGVYSVDWASPDAPSVAPEPSAPWSAPSGSTPRRCAACARAPRRGGRPVIVCRGRARPTPRATARMAPPRPARPTPPDPPRPPMAGGTSAAGMPRARHGTWASGARA